VAERERERERERQKKQLLPLIKMTKWYKFIFCESHSTCQGSFFWGVPTRWQCQKWSIQADPPLSTRDTFHDLPQLRETTDNTKHVHI